MRFQPTSQIDLGVEEAVWISTIGVRIHVAPGLYMDQLLVVESNAMTILYLAFMTNVGYYKQSSSKCINLNAPIATKIVCFFRLLKCLRNLYGKQCGPRSVLGPLCFILGNPGVTHSVPTAFITNAVGTEWVTPGLPRMTLFASILNLSVKLGNYFQRTTFSDAFFLGALRVNSIQHT